MADFYYIYGSLRPVGQIPMSSCYWKAFQRILNALQCIETDSNDSQRIYNVFLQTQAIVFNVLKCFSNVLECFFNVVQCIGNASKRFFFYR